MFMQFRARRRACEAAQTAARSLRPDEPLHGVVVCADEPGRFVVRVFCGNRVFKEPAMLPPWRECLIFAVAKDTYQAEPVTDPHYQPTLR